MNVEKYQSYLESCTLSELEAEREILYERIKVALPMPRVTAPASNFFTYADDLRARTDASTRIAMINSVIHEGEYKKKD